MFEKEIKFIIDFTLNRVNKLGSFFPFERLVSAEIHPAILSYISAYLDHLIYEDRKKLLQNSSFDYSGSEISKYFNLISEEIKKNKRLAFEDVRTLVTHAVTFNINYLVRPNWTLAKLIFDEDKTKNVNEIKMMLNYLYYYDYLKNVFFGYFSKRKILSLSETEFHMILGKIDQQMFSEHTHDLIDNALVSIGDFFNEGGLNKTRIHTQTVELFLKEKDLMEPLFKLRRSIPADDKRKYDIEEIRKILYSKEHLKAPPEEEEKEEERQEENETVSSEGTADINNLETETASEEIPSSVDEVQPEEVKDIDSSEGTHEFQVEDRMNEVSESPAETTREENEKKEMDPDSTEDFLTRYKTELKSLEELEEQLDDLNSENDLTFTELDEEDEEEESGEKNEPLEKEQNVTASNDRKEIEETPAPDIIPDEDTTSDELIIEEEELSFDDDDEITEEKKPEVPASPRLIMIY